MRRFDHFERSQYWLGYQFEHSFDQIWTVRQNVRYTDVDTNTYAVAGGGALGMTALQPNLQTLNRGTFTFPENAAALTMDNEAEARFSTGAFTHDALLGLDYRYFTSDLHEGFANAPPISTCGKCAQSACAWTPGGVSTRRRARIAGAG